MYFKEQLSNKKAVKLKPNSSTSPLFWVKLQNTIPNITD